MATQLLPEQTRAYQRPASAYEDAWVVEERRRRYKEANQLAAMQAQVQREREAVQREAALREAEAAGYLHGGFGPSNPGVERVLPNPSVTMRDARMLAGEQQMHSQNPITPDYTVEMAAADQAAANGQRYSPDAALGTAGAVPVERGAPPPSHGNPYLDVLSAYVGARKAQDPNWDFKNDEVYKRYHANWMASQGKASMVGTPTTPAPAPETPITPAETAAPEPAPGYYQQTPLPPVSGGFTPPNTQLMTLACVDGKCGPVSSGTPRPIINPQMSILGAYALADIVNQGNTAVMQANQSYDKMIQQMYENDPAFHQAVVAGMQRGLSHEEAYRGAIAQAAYAHGNNNLGNRAYFGDVVPGEARVAGHQIANADLYGGEYQAQSGMFGGNIPYHNIHTLTTNPDGTRNIQGVGDTLGNLPRGAGMTYANVAGSENPIGVSEARTREAYQTQAAETDRRNKETLDAEVQLSKAAGDYFKTVSTALANLAKTGNVSSLNGVPDISTLSPKEQAQVMRTLQQMQIDAEREGRNKDADAARLMKTNLEIKILEQRLAKGDAEADPLGVGDVAMP